MEIQMDDAEKFKAIEKRIENIDAKIISINNNIYNIHQTLQIINKNILDNMNNNSYFYYNVGTHLNYIINVLKQFFY